MLKWLENFGESLGRFVPNPLSIAIGLSIFTFFISLVFGFSESPTLSESGQKLLLAWVQGIFQSDLMVFAMQMMLMLVLGHIIALSPIFDKSIEKALVYCNTSAKAAAILSFSAMLVSLFNWGLGLIFGAVFARKIGEMAFKNSIPINYPLIGAAGYSGLMLWHGGISGSSLTKAAEIGHLQSLHQYKDLIPSAIDFQKTVFSGFNISTNVVLLIIVPLLLYFIGSKLPSNLPKSAFQIQKNQILSKVNNISWAFDASKILAVSLLAGLFLLFVQVEEGASFYTPNNINLLLLSAAFSIHRNLEAFSMALQQAIQGVSGILIQFPIYFGILGMMQVSGLIAQLSEMMIAVSSENTFPFYVFASAAITNFFIPSGGGQWAIQGPILVDATLALGNDFAKTLLAFAYGDQLTNMLQPFWALPLLGITKLKAQQILPFTFLIFLAGFVVFSVALFLG